MNLITVKIISYDHELIPYQIALDRAGIEFHLKDEHTITIDPLLSNAVGGIKIQVFEESLELALKEIEKIDSINNPIIGKKNIIHEGKSYHPILKDCLNCKEKVVYKQSKSPFTTLFSFFFFKDYFCVSCQHHWRNH